MMKESQTTRLQWPMSEERSVLRMNLISGLLDDVAYNVARKIIISPLRSRTRFLPNRRSNKNLPTEENHLALALTGNTMVKDWQTKSNSR